MRNNPFITVILLFCIEILLYIYINYVDLILPSSEYAGLMMPLFCFAIPCISVLISIFIDDIQYKKEFRNFTIFLVVTSVIVFMILAYLSALGRAYQH